MDLQIKYMILFGVLSAVLFICAFLAFRSDKPIGKQTGFLNISLILPIVANIMVASAHNEIISTIGYYLNYIGMTAVIFALIAFTNEYCQNVDGSGKMHRQSIILYILCMIDVIQLAFGPVFHHVIDIEQISIDGSNYYQDIPRFGLTFHRIVDYICFACVLLTFAVSTKKASKMYREKYLIIFVALLLSGLMQLFFILSKPPIDRSVVSHSVFGIIVFYFTIKYRSLKLLDAVLSNMAAGMDDSVFIFDAYKKCVWANAQGYRLLELEEGRYNLVRDSLIGMFGDLSKEDGSWTKDIFVPETRGYYIVEKKLIDSGKFIDGFFVIVKDNTERHARIEKELYESTHDGLTGLYNMQYLFNHIRSMLNSASPSEKYCVAYMNVRNFKIINDIFGKRFGNQVLIQLAEWIRTNVDSIDAVYGRLIGDTFGIFLPEDKFDESLFITGLSNFVVTDKNMSHQVCVHIGVYRIKDKTMDVSVMFDRANSTLASIAGQYKVAVRYYDDNFREQILEEQKLTADLPKAIEEGQVRVYLQPITDVDGKVVGAEALARWVHPELGFLAPFRFIPLFEKNGMITDVDKYIWKCACEVLHNWKDTYPDLFVSINVSPKDFYFMDVVEEITNLVKEYDIVPEKLRIEITETVMMVDPDEKIKVFDALRARGFIIEMDDFGSGYSSLNLLKDMPVDVLKIDMKFLAGTNNAKSETIIRNVIHLSDELQVTALTEGVETEEQYQQLIDMGCVLFQGYYFAKPMPVGEFETFIEEQLK